ncbi:MAG: WecB/TagA/CpsF family glycosyltransferase, partial [Kiritimatiellaceae bacterium]|nr:WecB/TagA/CpsF family glycosyltransferase [Kiritimatiellaceae bacterium]
MAKWLIEWGKWAVPILVSIAIFLFIHVLQKLGGLSLSSPSVIFLGIVSGVTLLGYVLQLKLLNRIGGAVLLWVTLAILIGMLLPGQAVRAYPEKASESVSQDFDAAWKAVYGKDLFEQFSLHQHLMEYAESLAHFDIHRAGQITLFALLGIAMGICFLFPIDPSKRGIYWKRWATLLLAGGLFSIQAELLQVLSPTRSVSFVDLMESLIGTYFGICSFSLLNLAYVIRKRSLKDRRFNVLGVGIDAVNMRDCLDLFEELISFDPTDGRRQQTAKNGQLDDLSLPQKRSTINLSSGLKTKLPAMTTAMGVAGIVESRRRQSLQRILNESVLNTPDGMPLVWLGKWAGYRGIERVYGPDLLRDACAYGEDKGWRHYFWGAAPGIVEKLKEVLEEKHPKIEISGICCPPFRPLTKEEEDTLVEEVNSSDTDIFWIGISTPKQLYFMDQIRDRLKCKIICPVGYAFDVNAGVEKDAPDWIKYSGLQWLHRGIKQPRLWKRYLPDNPMFILKVFVQRLLIKKFPMFRHERPIAPYKDAEGYDRFPAGCVSLSAMTMERARDRVANWVETGQRHYVNICTADTVVQCYDRPDMAEIVMNAGMATTDGMPLVWLARHFGYKDTTRVYGPDLMLELCALSEEKEYSHYFYGATNEVLEELKTNLLK